ncbi:MAG: ABC transporter ATP-binding protein [Lentisphaeria bacterium]|nr:ABC transporter ATP-binding protein [Lentisphaeria bacterium]
MDFLLDVTDLHVHFHLREGVLRAVNGVSLQVRPNQTLGVVGESGCGKSITAKAIMGLLPPKATITGGQVLLAPREPGGTPLELSSLKPNGKEMRGILGADIAMIFQEPMTSFSPVHTIGNQIVESIRLHRTATRKEARDIAIETLRLVQVPMAERRVDAYPHELSGGLRQRCMIAMALCCKPRMLVADEPTTALDVTIQAQILTLIRRLQSELQMAVMMITHDLGVIAQVADHVVVMYLGRVVEKADTPTLFAKPLHPYTLGLMASIPRLDQNEGTRLHSIRGSVPDPFFTPEGCPFHPRCDKFIAGTCDCGEPPELVDVAPNHAVACHLFSAGTTDSGSKPTTEECTEHAPA